MRCGTCLGLVVLLLAMPAVAAAQRAQMPAAGAFGVAFDAGVYVPHDGNYNVSLNLDGTGEFHVLGAVSVRAELGYAEPNLRDQSGSLRQVRLLFNVLYNWEEGYWHPYVTGGVGSYFLEPINRGLTATQWYTKFGWNAGGGLEVFARRNLSIKTELRYHAIRHNKYGSDPSGLTITAGLKRYF